MKPKLFRFWPVLTIFLWILFSGSTLAENASSHKSLFFESEDAFLSPDEAFSLNLFSRGNTGIEAQFKVSPGYYLYKQRIQFRLKDTSVGEISHLELPAGERKNDPNFGEQEVYHHDFVATFKTNAPQNAVLLATYQGCSEKGLCYAPQTKTFALDTLETAPSETMAHSDTKTQNIVSENESDHLLKSGRWWLIILGFFGAGLLLAFTPCVFPMIPILSSIIIGKNAHHSRWHAFSLSLAYTLGMCLTYTLMGIAAGLSGQLLSNMLQTPWALSIGALIFVLLALSMFGFYELKLPHTVENRFFNWSHRIKGGHLFSDFVMGIISALVVSPCVAAPLAGALLYISKTHDILLGGIALFSLSLGMGAPLLLIGASAGTLLPKVGAWMNAVRHLFGVLMLGVAVWLITPVIPIGLQLTLWSALLIIPSIYMHALDNLPADAKPVMKLWKGCAIMMLVGGIALLIGALSGARSPLQPLSGLFVTASSQTNTSDIHFQRIRSISDLEKTLDSAKGKTVMLDFYADWCVSCKEFEQFVFTDPRVKVQLNRMVLLQADVTENNSDDQALLRQFELFGPPGILFFDASGQRLSEKVVGYQDAETFLATLNRVNPS